MHYSIGKPIEHKPGKWRCYVTIAGRRRWAPLSKSPAEATEAAERMAQIAASGPLTVDETIDSYLEHLRAGGARERSIETAGHQVRSFFRPVLDRPLALLTPRRAADLYEELRSRPGSNGKPPAVRTQRECLKRAKALLAWCVERRLVKVSPISGVKPVGTANRGKAQLRIDEARRLVARGLELAATGDAGALAVLIGLLCGLRSGEIVSRTVRDLDDGGAILCIDDADDGWKPKSRAGRRAVGVPEALRPLLRQFIDGKTASELIFKPPFAKRHRADWVNWHTHRLCKLIGAPAVCAHSMRGLHATIAVQAGASPHLVARTLGHESPTITLGAYAQPGSEQIANSNEAVNRLMN